VAAITTAPGSEATTKRAKYYPRQWEGQYARFLRRRVKILTALVADQVAELLEDAQEREDLDAMFRADSDSVFVRAFDVMIEALRRVLPSIALIRPKRLLPFGKGVDRHAERTLGIQVKVPVRDAFTGDIINNWARTNADLITNMGHTYLDDVAKQVSKAVIEGTTTKDLAKIIRERTGVGLRRADLLARDQISTLNSQITRARQEAAGITEFVWVDSGDSRVRTSHEQLHNQTFSWVTGAPGEGRPGEPINCRCTAEPVIPD